MPPADIDHHHRDVTGGAMRAAVFGVSDGLTTNVALILGVAGAHPGPGFVRLAGLAGLVGGAFSMAAGEWVSMRAQAELIQRELDVERQALAQRPDAERHELAALYRGRGVDRATADSMADQVHADIDQALEVHAREEMGVDPSHLGSPTAASTSSFAAFGVGALIPLLPWLFTSGGLAIALSLIMAGVAAASVGALLARFTTRPAWRSALRQVAIAGAAAGITYAIGALVGTSAT